MSKQCIFALKFALLLVPAVTLRADIVIDWNKTANETIAANIDKHNPGMASRTLAMLNLALYDGLSMVKPGGKMYYNYGMGNTSTGYAASGTAAAAQAAYTVLSSIYPDRTAALSSRLTASLSSVADGADKSSGIAIGKLIGQSIVQKRVNDGYTNIVPYQPNPAAGHWQPDPINPTQQAWGPGWGQVTPFSLTSASQIAPPAPPALTSQQYADSFNEVKSLGALNSTTRTAEQTQIGNFWAYDRVGMGTPLRLYNEVLQTIAVQRGNTVDQNAELFAKASVAMADAGVVTWAAKYEHDLWRPVTGIRNADMDGNLLTISDPNWVPLGAPGGTNSNFTPAFPAYISGHATFGAATFETLKEFYGSDAMNYTLISEELPGVQRSFTTFSQAMAENGRSRVYLGIHWDFDDLQGRLTGQEIARYISGRPFIAAVPEPTSAWVLCSVVSGLALRRRQRRLVWKNVPTS